MRPFELKIRTYVLGAEYMATRFALQLCVDGLEGATFARKPTGQGPAPATAGNVVFARRSVCA